MKEVIEGREEGDPPLYHLGPLWSGMVDPCVLTISFISFILGNGYRNN